jgi:hypothetical protein
VGLHARLGHFWGLFAIISPPFFLKLHATFDIPAVPFAPLPQLPVIRPILKTREAPWATILRRSGKMSDSRHGFCSFALEQGGQQ